MKWDFLFFANSALFGVGLAMDAFSVSIANGLKDNRMKIGRMCLIAGTFGVFQAAMPMIGWLCVHTIATIFEPFQMFIPWIALGLLLFLGIKMIVEGVKGEEEEVKTNLSFGALMVQGIATSIDALSVGFTIADLDWFPALVESLIICAVTFILCMIALVIGKKVGNKIGGKATIVGGIILIAIGLEIFIKGIFF